MLARDERRHHLLELAGGHLAVAHHDARLGHERGEAFRDALDRLDAVVEVEHLAAPRQLRLDGVAHQPLVVAADDGADGQALARRRLDDAQVAGAHEREVERARDRRRAHREDVDLGAEPLQPLLVAHAEAVLLVDDDQAQPGEGRPVGEQRVRADHDVDRSGGGARPDGGLLLGCPVAAEQLDGHGPAGQPLPETLVMLLGQHGRRCQDCHLAAAERALEGGAQRHLRLTEADVAADEPVHGCRPFQVGLHVGDGPRLVGRLAVRERTFELAHPGVVDVARVRDARLRRTFGLQGQQLRREVGGGLLGGLARALPPAAAELGELRLRPAEPDVAREEVGFPHREV